MWGRRTNQQHATAHVHLEIQCITQCKSRQTRGFPGSSFYKLKFAKTSQWSQYSSSRQIFIFICLFQTNICQSLRKRIMATWSFRYAFFYSQSDCRNGQDLACSRFNKKIIGTCNRRLHDYQIIYVHTGRPCGSFLNVTQTCVWGKAVMMGKCLLFWIRSRRDERCLIFERGESISYAGIFYRKISC